MASHADAAVTIRSLDELVARARALASAPGRTLLGVTGPPGAGKSTVTDGIVAALGPSAVVVPMDGFHLANEVLVAHGSRERKGAPDTFDTAGYVALLRRLRNADGVVYAPRFDREIEESIGSAIPVRADVPLVVTEGNYLLLAQPGWTEVRALLDEVWFLDVDVEEIRRRLIARRIGHGHAAVDADAWVRDVDEPNARIVIRTRAAADVIADLQETAADPDLTLTKEHR